MRDLVVEYIDNILRSMQSGQGGVRYHRIGTEPAQLAAYRPDRENSLAAQLYIKTIMTWLCCHCFWPNLFGKAPIVVVLLLVALRATTPATAGPVNVAEARRILQESFRATPEEIVEIPLSRLGGYRKGEPGVGIVLVEFSDFACGHCQAFNLVTYPKIEASLITPGHVLYISCNFFFQTANDAKAVLAAGLQDKYWDMKARLFEEWGRLDQEVYLKLARDLGLNINDFLSDYKLDAIARRAEDERRLGQNIGVKTTPTFLLGWQLSDGTFVGQRIRGPKPWTFFRERVERIRQLK